jgi:hypothetical protein
MTRRKQTAQTKAACGQGCTLRFFGGGCQGDVVACHIKAKGQGSVGMKQDDVFTVFGCDRCHAALDRRRNEWKAFPEGVYWETILRAFIETLKIKMGMEIVERKL